MLIVVIHVQLAHQLVTVLNVMMPLIVPNVLQGGLLITNNVLHAPQLLIVLNVVMLLPVQNALLILSSMPKIHVISVLP